jgi:ABC-type transport system substrate-binding protein
MEDELVGDNPALRKALSYGVNREKYVELFTNNRGEIAYGFIPPLMDAYSENIKDAGIGYDPNKARRLVEQARQAAGGSLGELTLSVPGTGIVMRQRGQFLQRGWKQIGLDVKVEYMDWPTFQNRVNNKGTQMFMMGWIADYPDAENFLQLFYGPNKSPGSNNFNYDRSEFNELYEEVSVMRESPQRRKLYREAERIVVQDCPAIFLFHGVAFVLKHHWVENYKPHAFQYGTSKYRDINRRQRQNYRKLLRELP